MNVAAIIQARMGSTRLPGKVLLGLAGEPMLARTVERVRRARLIEQVVVATTRSPEDDIIEELCAARHWRCHRGSTEDLLDRYYRAARHCGAEVVVRITSDCPMIEPVVIDMVIEAFLDGHPKFQYVSNIFPTRTYPRGLDTEVFSFAALEQAWQNDDNEAWREHVTPYMQRHPELFSSHCVTHPVDFSLHRWTVDTPADLEFARRVYEHFGHDRFTWTEVLTLLDHKPDWVEINRKVAQKVIP